MKERALITGASAGIGLAFARKLASEGYNLVLVARRKNRLEEIKKELEDSYSVEVQIIQGDLTKEEDRKHIYQETLEKGKDIHLVVNNAGIGSIHRFHQSPWEINQRMIQLNISAVTEIAHTFLQPMVQRKSGAMIIVASTASFQPIPYFTVYGATKAYDYFLAMGLYQELKKDGVHVMALCPGPTITEFGGEEMDIRRMAGFLAFTADRVVEICWKGYKKRKKAVVPGFFNSLGIFVQRFLPASLVLWINAKIFERVYQKTLKERNKLE
ncbi:MAG: SDR family oxidoreductase [Planctomycetota bacterium]|nr:MAG: SDR family oxidoreductase [Planctomycetota bacterium]